MKLLTELKTKVLNKKKTGKGTDPRPVNPTSQPVSLRSISMLDCHILPSVLCGHCLSDFVVSVLAIGPKIHGVKPGRRQRIFTGDKNS
jgi:hypothetical protein